MLFGKQHKLDELSAVAGKLAERLKKVKSSAGPIKSEKAALREELYHIKNTKDKYTDSDKVRRTRSLREHGIHKRYDHAAVLYWHRGLNHFSRKKLPHD